MDLSLVPSVKLSPAEPSKVIPSESELATYLHFLIFGSGKSESPCANDSIVTLRSASIVVSGLPVVAVLTNFQSTPFKVILLLGAGLLLNLIHPLGFSSFFCSSLAPPLSVGPEGVPLSWRLQR